MKIFYVDPQSYNNLADYDNYLLQNINEQKIFFCSYNMPYPDIKNTVISRIYNYHKKTKVKKILSYSNSQFKLLKSVKKEKPDIIHFQWFKIPFLDYAIIKCIKQCSPNTTIVHTAHNVLPHDSGAKYTKIYRKIYNFVDNIIVHAEITKKEICNEFGVSDNKITVIPHGFLPTKYKFPKIKNGNNIITFSFIGFLSDYKGLDILLDAWCNNSEILNNKKCRLIIAGAGELPCLKNIPSDKNIILENYFHTEEELAKIVNSTDIAVLPYRKISQSGVLLTYLAEHIPVLVSNIGGLVQPFSIGKVGWVLENLNSQDLSKLIETILSDKNELESICKNDEVWNRIDEFYDWKTIGNKTYSLYQNKR